jgi:hypothetical protein
MCWWVFPQRQRSPIRLHLDAVSTLHPLVEAARRKLRAGKASEEKIVSTNHETELAIAVAPSSISRAVHIVNALIRAWEEHGGTVRAGERSFLGHHRTAFAVGEDRVLVSLIERTEPIPDWKPPKNDYWHRYPPRRPSGRLVFAIEHFGGDGLRSSWSDGKRQRLENILSEVYEGLMIQIGSEKRQRLDNQCLGRQRAAAEERRKAKERFQSEETERRTALKNEIERWQNANEIREYLTAMHDAVARGTIQVMDENVFAKWTDWVSWYADHLDPLVLAPLQPLESRPPTNTPVAALDLTSRARRVIAELGVADSDGLFHASKAQIETIEKELNARAWDEICRVLEGLGYNMNGRSYWL